MKDIRVKGSVPLWAEDKTLLSLTKSNYYKCAKCIFIIIDIRVNLYIKMDKLSNINT